MHSARNLVMLLGMGLEDVRPGRVNAKQRIN